MFLIIARLSSEKAIDVLIKAFANVVKQYSDTQLMIGGDGPEQGPLKQLVQQLNIQSNVQFLGSLSRQQVKEAFEQCHFSVLSSLIEAQPVVICESFAMGVPVVVTTVVSDDVVTKETGILVPPDDIQALGKGLMQAIETVDQYDSEKIRAFSVEQFIMIEYESASKVYTHILFFNKRILRFNEGAYSVKNN